MLLLNNYKLLYSKERYSKDIRYSVVNFKNKFWDWLQRLYITTCSVECIYFIMSLPVRLWICSFIYTFYFVIVSISKNKLSTSLQPLKGKMHWSTSFQYKKIRKHNMKHNTCIVLLPWKTTKNLLQNSKWRVVHLSLKN